MGSLKDRAIPQAGRATAADAVEPVSVSSKAGVPIAAYPNPCGDLRQRLAWAIMSASVVVEPPLMPGLAPQKRALGYYLGLGIDHYRHPWERNDMLLFAAVDAVLKELSAQGIAARSDETPSAAQPEARQPGPKDAPTPHREQTNDT